MENKVLFQEKQKFTQWWLWMILLTPAFFIFYELLLPLFRGNSNTSGNVAVSVVIPNESLVALFILLLVLGFMYFSTLKTTVHSDRIVVRHLLFVKKEWFWNEVQSVEIIKYGFVGYGIRFSMNHGTVYNVKGNKGLFLKLKNGKKRLLGTQKPKELEKVVSSILKNL